MVYDCNIPASSEIACFVSHFYCILSIANDFFLIALDSLTPQRASYDNIAQIGPLQLIQVEYKDRKNRLIII